MELKCPWRDGTTAVSLADADLAQFAVEDGGQVAGWLAWLWTGPNRRHHLQIELARCYLRSFLRTSGECSSGNQRICRVAELWVERAD